MHRTTRAARHFSIAAATMAAGRASRIRAHIAVRWGTLGLTVVSRRHLAAPASGPEHLAAFRQGGCREDSPRAARAVSEAASTAADSAAAASTVGDGVRRFGKYVKGEGAE